MQSKICFTILILFALKGAYCQDDLSYSSAPGYSPFQVITLKYNGKTYSDYVKDEITGSPFLFDDWRSGVITLTDGKSYANILLKYDVLNNKFLFNHKDSTYEFLDVLQQVTIVDTGTSFNNDFLIFEKINSKIDKIKAGSFVQILCNGNIKLYKHHSKKIEGQNFNNGINTSIKRIVDHYSFWATVKNESFPIKINKNSLEEITWDKKEELKSYIIKNHLKLNKEKDFTIAIKYYNNLIK